MSKILITGGAGYIGAHVAAELLSQGYSVRIYDDFSNGLHRRVDGKFRDVVDGDILDRERLIEALQGIDGVIHLAAKKSVEESVKNPLQYYENNVGGTLNLLAAMSVKSVKSLVFSSSAAVYSPSDKDAIEESDDEDDFQNIDADKYVDIHKVLYIECNFNNKFKKWVPNKVVSRREKIAHVSQL